VTHEAAAARRSDAAPQASPARARWRRLLGLASLALATALLLLEGILQAGAYYVWRRDRQPVPEIPAGHRAVLCVGDSWTHGMGSSDVSRHSYPAVLQELLRSSTDTAWTVVNGGLSGQNSRDVLQRLPSQLDNFRPSIVCVLVGQNDFWSAPEQLPEGQSDTIDFQTYRFRWRIPRLIHWIAGRLGGGEAAGQVRPARAVDKSGPEWAPRPRQQQDPYANERRKWPYVPAAVELQTEGWRLDSEKDLVGAIAKFEAALALNPEDMGARQALASLCRRAGRAADAAGHLNLLLESWRRDGDYWTGRSAALALNDFGRSDEAIEIARPLVESRPLDSLLWRCRAEAEFKSGRHAEAKQSIDKAIELAADPWAWFWRYKILAMGLQDHDESVRTLFDAYVHFNDATATARDLRMAATVKKATERMRPVLAAFPCPEDVRQRLEILVDEAIDAIEGATARHVLAAHLPRIATLVRNAGGTPVFLTYPMQMPAEEVLRRAAADAEVRFIDVRKRFHELLAGRSWESVRAPDGHCNDDGYRLMAQAVAEGLQPVLAKLAR
jgi:lysophospholipase L1-like esterase